MQTTKVLIVERDKMDMMSTLTSIKEESPYIEIITAKSIFAANREVTKSLRTNSPFNIIFVDIKVGKNSGAEFARRLINIIVDVNVVILTNYYDPAASLSFDVDAIVIKGKNQNQMSNTLIGVIRELATPKRIRKNCLDVTLHMWEASKYMHGINELIQLTKVYSGQNNELVEKITSFTNEHRWINCVTYPKQPCDRVEHVAIQTTIGCNYKCLFCINWRNQKDIDGRVIPYIRPLTSGEMVSQVYLSMLNTRIKNLFSKSNPLGLVVNFSGAGDGLTNNLANCAEVIQQLSKIKKPQISFIMTSVGREDSLQEYIDKYVNLPRVTHYWSVNSTRLRNWLMPGTKNQSLEVMRDLYQEIAERSGRFITASFAIFKGVNDTEQDVEKIVKLFKGRPFRIKLMAGCPGSLRGIPDISTDEVFSFREKLILAGIEDCRFRPIFGIDPDEGGYSGCGKTEADFVVKGNKV